MKGNIYKLAMVLLTCTFSFSTLWAQSPEKMSYQAVIRDASDNLITDTQVGMQISILQGSASGTAVYVETQEPTTNANGLVSIEIGTGTTSDDFSTIDWANGIYFIKTETDPTGGTSYTITGTSQLLSVPYAMHSKTAEAVTGGITETDPAVSANFDFTDAANGDLLQFNGTKWVKVTPDYISDYTVTESDVTTHQEALSITESQISDLDHFTTADETDLVFGASVASGITGTDTTNWNNKLDSETDPSVPDGTTAGDMQYWNGTAWVTVSSGSEGQVLTFTGDVPTWTTQLEDGDVKNPTTGEVWMDRNLGASQVAISSTDAAAYGDLYQWGRGTDGHESRTSGTTSTLATSDTPGHGDFITNSSDWRNPQNDNLWQGVNGTNNPCPNGYRLPTEAEWEAERTSWSSNNAAGAFASPLKLPVAGHRRNINGSLLDVGSYGYYWKSTVDGILSRYLIIESSTAYMRSNNRTFGYSVRCIKD